MAPQPPQEVIDYLRFKESTGETKVRAETRFIWSPNLNCINIPSLNVVYMSIY